MKISIFKYIVWIILPFFIIGCSVGKYIPEGEYYLKDIKVDCEDEKVDEGTGTILRNIIEDTLEEYDDLSVNDRVGILLEMIEKIIG